MHSLTSTWTVTKLILNYMHISSQKVRLLKNINLWPFRVLVGLCKTMNLYLQAKLCMLLGKLRCKKIFKLNDEVNFLYVQYCLGILPTSYVFDLRRLYFLFKQSTHIISVHNIFTMCQVFEFNKLCSVYSVGKLSHGHFTACVWYAFYVCITQVYCLSYFLSVCFTLHCFCVNKDYHKL